jgi:hypothetical protein
VRPRGRRGETRGARAAQLRDAVAARGLAVLWRDCWTDSERVALAEYDSHGYSDEEDAAADRYYCDMEENPGTYRAMFAEATRRTSG